MEKLKKYFYIVLVLLLFLPIAQRFFKFHISEPLNGLAAFSDYPTFHLKDWHKGKYQKTVEIFVNDNFGFRNTLLRWANSFDYWVFRYSNTKDLVIGKDGHLFFDYNIDNYLGITQQNRKHIDSLFVETDQLNKKLKERGIELIFVIAPSNAYYYSDKFPPQYDRYPKKENDYDYYLKKLNQYKISYVDFNKWFLEIKDTVSIDLFPKNGTHYTYFSAVWLADSLVGYLENKKNIDMPEIIYESTRIDTMTKTEHDLENILNLSHKLDNEKLYYYKLKFNTENKTTPKVLTVGDSFYWPVLNQMIPKNCFGNVAYWFYNDAVFPESFTKKKTTDQVDLDSLFNGLDFIIIFSSATLMNNYDYNGFIGDMQDYLNGNYTIRKEDEELQYWINAIHNNPDWYNKIKQKAENMNIPVDEQIKNEALWMIQQEKKKKQN
ncbi:MAG TPA: hypothetical protein PKN32_08975 [Bacteroidales bacterium]|nr:hypothetical protein [Bacteroidales bacterium]